MNIKSLTSMSALLFSGVIFSGIAVNAQASDFSYTFIEGSVESVDSDGPDADIYRISGSYNISPNFNIIADLATGDIDNPSSSNDFDFDEGSLGIGYHTPIAPSTDFTANVRAINRDSDLAEDDTGYGVGVGLRHMLTNRIEVDANVDFVDVQEVEDTALKVSARYYFNSAISAGLAYSTSSEDVDVVSGNIRWDF